MRRNLRLQVILLLFIAFGGTLVCFSGCNSNDAPSTTTSINTASKPRANSAPPSTALPMPPVNGSSLNNLGWTFEGNKRNIFSDFRGKVLILDFYATWCQPCRRSVPHLIELQRKYQDQGLNVVGLNVGGPEDEAEVPEFAKQFGIQYTLAIPDDDLVNLLMAQIDAIPQTFVFDRQGLLAERLIGYGPDAGDRLDRAVEAALKSPAP